MSTTVTLTEAASYLGVTKTTLRNWDKDGKLTALRNPLNKYRLYNMDDLIKIKHKIPGNMETNNFVETSSQDFDSKAIKQLISRLHSIIRDSDISSNIMERFDELSKLLFLKLYAENADTKLFDLKNTESVDLFTERVKYEYSSLIKKLNLNTPENYSTINLPKQALYQCGTELSKVDISNTAADVKGIAYEDTIKGTFDKSDNQQYFTPYQIVDFIVEMMDEYLHGVVCDPACGTAGFLTKVIEKHNDVSILGLEVDERLSWISTMNILIHGKKDFEVAYLPNGGSLGENAKKYYGTVNAIVTNPPFGSDYTDQDILFNFTLGRGKSSRRRGILFIEQAWNLLCEGGVVAIIIDQSVINAPSGRDVREFILKHFDVLAVVELPDTAFQPYASVSSSILFLRKTHNLTKGLKTFFAKSTKIGRKNNGDDSIVYLDNGESKLDSDLPNILENWKLFKECTSFSTKDYFAVNILDDISNNNDLRLDYTYNHPYRKSSQLSIEKSKYDVYTLAEICDERNESYIPSADSTSTSMLFTGLANIESFTGKATQVITPTASVKSAVKKYEPGDIIFAKMRPSLRKITFVSFENEGYVSSECDVYTVKKINGKPIIEPRLLTAILRSDFVYGQIMGYVTGIGRPRINSKYLRKIRIPVPPKEIQDKICDMLSTSITTVNQLRLKAAALYNTADDMDKKALNDAAKMLVGEKNG